MKQKLKLVWVDQKINNQENLGYQKKLKQIIDECSFIDSSDAHALNKFYDEKSGQKYVAIVSGKDFQEKSRSLNSNQIVFCGNCDIHFSKFLITSNVLVLIDSGFPLLEVYVQRNIKFLIAQESLNQSFCRKVEENLDYYHQIEEISFRFLLINQKLQTNFQFSENLLNEEIVQLFNKENEENGKKEDNQEKLQKLVELAKKKSNIKMQKTKQQFTIFEKLILYYSTDQFYNVLNRNLAKSKYEQMEHIMRILFYGYSELQIKYQEQKQITPDILYRGISFTNEQAFLQIINQLKQCEKNKECVFWNTLVSTSIKQEVGDQFLKPSLSILFEIKLKKKNPHPFFVLQPYHSKFPTEEEVLLFPQFQFKILEINSYKRKGNGNWFCRIEQIENEFSMALSLDENSRKKYWEIGQRISSNHNCKQLLSFTKLEQIIQLIT